MFEVLASNPGGFSSLGVAIAACQSGFSGVLNLEHCAAARAEIVLAQANNANVEFTVCVSEVTGEYLEILGQASRGVRSAASSSPPVKEHIDHEEGGEGTPFRGLRRVILANISQEQMPGAISALRSIGLKVLVQVTSLDEARRAENEGADGLVLKGSEAGGRIGEATAFILLQQVSQAVSLPLIVRGGIGIRTAGACMAAGVAGVLLDWQLALCDESDLPQPVRQRLELMDGSETAVLGHQSSHRYRVYAGPGETGYQGLKELEEREGLGPASDRSTLDAWKSAVEASIRDKSVFLVGQDAAFASRISRQYRTVGAACGAVQYEALRNARVAFRRNPLREDGPLAQSHGTRYPIVQGPMTRVSDRSDFALAVAEGGGLPFLALTLLKGRQLADLLEDTKRKLGDRPWGVGLLGFVPEALRDEQLEEVRKHRPPYALIAGGRPDQAKALEAEGTRTYLHIPSPELLRTFLENGVRRVMFEGRECGGHVGPRTSFVLWELMIDVILKRLEDSRDHAEDYHVLFAGGIHDGLSGAMVSALSAPLAERGVRVGVLLGTGYLFTEEAVKSGAIVEGFQRQAIACSETTLLESGPGHATRCAKTPFVDHFAQQERQLQQEGRSKEEIRDSLESLNLERLRVASKGIKRRDSGAGGARYVTVDDDRQYRDGMYMIGQVAALRGSTCTIEELHSDVCSAGEHLGDSLTAVDRDSAVAGPRGRSSDIAIIGMSCVFPKADDLAGYWQNILNKVDALGDVPKERWDSDLYFSEDRGARDRIYSRRGGFIGDFPFDPISYGMPPNSVSSIDPIQLVTLELARRALKDAGYDRKPFDRERTSVVVGVGGGVADVGLFYAFRSMAPYFFSEAGGSREDADRLVSNLDHCLPEWTEDSFAGLLLNVLAGRIANRLDLGGANYSVDAACATSLAAVRLACAELQTGASTMAIAAGADMMQSPFTYQCFSATHALSPTGECRTFDESGDGIVIGEGVAVTILKRLEDAEADGDRIYAVIKGVGASGDGKDKGLTAPRPAGQVRALSRAYEIAGVSPDTVGLIEAHGTGTIVGDRTEVESLTRYFGQSGAEHQSCALGSVKTMIGHTKCTAGMAGMLKAAMALHDAVLPPMIGVTNPNKKTDFPNTPFYLSTETRPWVRRKDGAPRRAGVSAFGFGGTNYHAVLEEYSPPAHAPVKRSTVRDWPAELFLWRADSADEILSSIRQIQAAISDGATPVLCELAATVYWEHARDAGKHCLAVVAGSLEELKTKLAGAEPKLAQGDRRIVDPKGVYYSAEPLAGSGTVAFAFPGQGSQRVAMLRDLAVAFPVIRRTFEEADENLDGDTGRQLSHCVFPPPTFTSEDTATAESALQQTDVAQPAIGAADLGVFRLLQAFGILPDMACGHSYGEFAALCAAGAIAAEDLPRISAGRGRLILEAAAQERGTMAAVSAGEEAVSSVVEEIDGVCIANLNAPSQTVISGTRQGVEEALRRFAAQNVSARQIPVSCAFHSNLVAGAAEPFLQLLNSSALNAPRIPVYSNTTAAPHSTDGAEMRETLTKHLTAPVRFAEEVLAMYEAGARIFVEAGPGKVLTGLIGRILGDREHLAVAIDQPKRHGLVQLTHALGQLASAGVMFHGYQLFEGRVHRHLELARLSEETKAKHSPPTWIIRNGRIVPPTGMPERPERKLVLYTGADAKKGLAESEPAVPGKITPTAASTPSYLPGSGGAQLPGADIEAVMQGHHRLMNKVLETQKNIILSYLQAQNGSAEMQPESAAEQTKTRGLVEATPAAAASAPQQRVEFVRPDDGLAAAEPAGSEVSPQPVAESAETPITEQLITDSLVALVSERTGYPPEMLDLDLDLEADLGIDSIKRVEILGALQDTSILPADSGGFDTEALASQKTLRDIVAWLVDQVGGEAGEVAVATPPVTPDEALPASEPAEGPRKQVTRMRVEVFETPIAVPGGDPVGPVVITDDGSGVASALSSELDRREIANRIIGGDADLARPDVAAQISARIRAELGPISALVHLIPLAQRDSNGIGSSRDDFSTGTKSLFNLVQQFERDLRRNGDGRVITATRMGGVFGFAGTGSDERFRPGQGAVCGLVKSLAREWPEVSARAVDFEFGAANGEMTARLITELGSRGGPVEVGYLKGKRCSLGPAEAHLENAGAGIELSRDSVVLFTGGARGITAETAIELAENFPCRLILVGKSNLPTGSEDSETAHLETPREIKAALLERHKKSGERPTPAVIERVYKKLLKERKIRSSLAAMEQAGAQVEYHAVDVSDREAFGALIEGVYERYGRIDGVIHGAGVIEDKLVRDKSADSFDRVVAPKIDGALAFAELLRPESLRFMIFFSSVSARYGNRGQCDYAAANEFLNKLAVWLDHRWPGRIVSINWGPWRTDGGMVSDELAEQFAKAGVELIEPAGGRKAFLRELTHGPKGDAEVVWGGPLRHPDEIGGDEPSLESYPLLSKGSGSRIVRGGQRLEVKRDVDPARDIYLHDHQLDGVLVFPMTMALELMGEAASAMAAGVPVSAIRDVKVLRVITFNDARSRPLSVVRTGFRSNGAGSDVEVAIQSGESGEELHYRALVELRGHADLKLEANSLELVNPKPLSMSLQSAYDEWLFHGPLFAGIQGVEAIGENGVIGSLRRSSPKNYFGYAPDSRWLLDPAMLDSAFQLIILWARTHLDKTPLPSRLKCCHILGEIPEDAIRCEVEVRNERGSAMIVTDIQLFDSRGRLWCRLDDMEFTCSSSLNRLGSQRAYSAKVGG